MYQVQTMDDLARLRAGYRDLLESGWKGTLEVRFTTGGGAAGMWDLWPERKSRAALAPPGIDLVLLGDGGPLPGTLSRVLARSVRLENLVVTGSRSVALSFEVAGAFTMSGCALLDGRWDDPHGGEGFLVVAGRRGGDAVRVTLEDSWFVRNWQNAPMPMIDVRSAVEQGAFADEVAVRRSAFLANAFHREIRVRRAERVTIEDSVFFKTWPDGEVLECGERVPVRVTRSAFAVPAIGFLASASGCPNLDLTHSRVFAPAGPGPAWAEGVLDPASFPTAELSALLLAQIEQGRVPDASARAALAALLKMPG